MGAEGAMTTAVGCNSRRQPTTEAEAVGRLPPSLPPSPAAAAASTQQQQQQQQPQLNPQQMDSLLEGVDAAEPCQRESEEEDEAEPRRLSSGLPACPGRSPDGDSEGDWDHSSDVEQSETEALDADTLNRIWRVCPPIVQHCFSPLFGLQPTRGGPPGLKRSGGKAGLVVKPTCGNPTCSGRLEGTSASFKHSIETNRNGPVGCVKCRSCSHKADISQGGSVREIALGDVIWTTKGDSRQLWLVRAVKKGDGGGGRRGANAEYNRASFHVQRLSTGLRLPAAHGEGTSVYDINDAAAADPDGSFVLLRGHHDEPMSSFVADWSAGKAGLLPCPERRRLWYTALDGSYDTLAVPPTCPTFDACCGCACLNPWALRGATGMRRLRHAGCCASGGSTGQQRLQELEACYLPGDLVQLLPPGTEGEVDQQTDLARINRLYQRAIDSQDSFQCDIPTEEWVECAMYSRSQEGAHFVYRRTGEVLQYRASRLRGRLDRDSLPTYMQVLEGADGIDGDGIGGAAASAGGTAGGGGSQEATAAAAGDLSARSTPSGTDGAAHVSSPSGSGRDVNSSQTGWADGEDSAAGCAAGTGAVSSSSSSSSLRPTAICDTFSGFGGLSLGLEGALGPSARAKWAVDMFPAALDTYKGCHKGARVYEEDVCTFLERIRRMEDGCPPQGESAREWRVLVGGPPCQGFSMANKSDKKDKARKNVLLALFLSVLEELQWPYAIIENVAGLLRAGDTIQCVMHCLVRMGWQVSWRLLNAGNFGTGQHRRRVVILAAKHGLPHPSHPIPTHVFEGAGGYTKDGVCSLEARCQRVQSGVPKKWQANVVTATCAPLPSLTCLQVIGDLPAELGGTYGTPWIGDGTPSYYGAHMRGGEKGAEDPLDNHETWNLQPDTRACLAKLPKEGQPGWEQGADAWPGPPEHPQRPRRAGDWRSILKACPHLVAPYLLEKEDDTKTWGRFGRLIKSSHFATCLTRPKLNSETTSTTVHPAADRPLSVREMARVQGVPDRVRFCGVRMECYKQVGNAVPPPLAEAIGRELRKALILAQQQQPQPQQRRSS